MADEYTPTTGAERALETSIGEHLRDARNGIFPDDLAGVVLAAGWVPAAEYRRHLLLETAHKWSWGAWASTPRHRDRIADRMGASQYVGDWLRSLAEQGH